LKQVFVIIPNLTPDGPMKGAVALCNGMAGRAGMHLVSINGGEKSVEDELDKDVGRIRLEECGSWLEKVEKLKTIVKEADQGSRPTLISYSLKADIFSLAVSARVKRICRVSANLMKNYQYDYGWKGICAAIAHYQLMRLFDMVVTMSDSMTEQLRGYGVKKTLKIGNFIDEAKIEQIRESAKAGNDTVRFMFLGSLSKRKRPELLIKAAVEANKKGGKCRIDMVGDGPLRAELENLIKTNRAEDFIKLHGYVARPHSILINCDYMVLPSESEGMSRAVIESLYLGVACIMRDVDGNQEIIKHGINGDLFSSDNEFIKLISDKTINGPKRGGERKCLLPDEYRQGNCVERYMELLG
jgi:glycosyltransferase involved in cell wall biosynthesis